MLRLLISAIMRIVAKAVAGILPGRLRISARLTAARPLAYSEVGQTLIRPQTRWCLIDVVAFVFLRTRHRPAVAGQGGNRLTRTAAPGVVATQDPRPWIPEITQ